MRPSKLPVVSILGVGVVIVRDGRYLLGLRKSVLGFGTWGFPGGHVEPGEDPLIAGSRELAEETGLELIGARAAGWFSHSAAERQYVTLYVEGDAYGEAVVAEPTKCREWHWFGVPDLPKALFAPTSAYFRSLMSSAGELPASFTVR